MNIICVEDSLRHLCALQQTTRQIAPEASVYACLNADDAEKTARKYGCDVLLTGIDVGKSETGGIELARQVKKINPRVNIIFTTVHPEREYARDVLQLRASGYIRKPFSSQELKKEFENLRYPVG